MALVPHAIQMVFSHHCYCLIVVGPGRLNVDLHVDYNVEVQTFTVYII